MTRLARRRVRRRLDAPGDAAVKLRQAAVKAEVPERLDEDVGNLVADFAGGEGGFKVLEVIGEKVGKFEIEIRRPEVVVVAVKVAGVVLAAPGTGVRSTAATFEEFLEPVAVAVFGVSGFERGFAFVHFDAAGGVKVARGR